MSGVKGRVQDQPLVGVPSGCYFAVNRAVWDEEQPTLLRYLTERAERPAPISKRGWPYWAVGPAEFLGLNDNPPYGMSVAVFKRRFAIPAWRGKSRARVVEEHMLPTYRFPSEAEKGVIAQEVAP